MGKLIKNRAALKIAQDIRAKVQPIKTRWCKKNFIPVQNVSMYAESGRVFDSTIIQKNVFEATGRLVVSICFTHPDHNLLIETFKKEISKKKLLICDKSSSHFIVSTPQTEMNFEIEQLKREQIGTEKKEYLTKVFSNFIDKKVNDVKINVIISFDDGTSIESLDGKTLLNFDNTTEMCEELNFSSELIKITGYLNTALNTFKDSYKRMSTLEEIKLIWGIRDWLNK